MAIFKCFQSLKASSQSPGQSLNTLIRSLSSSKQSPINNDKVTYKLPVKEVSNERKNLLSVFYTDYNLALNMSTILNSLDWSPDGIRKILKQKREQELDAMQQYFPLRAETLGTDLAAAHFIVHRGGKVKFHGSEEWIQMDPKKNESNLPKFYDKSFVTEALDCSQMTLTYQGLLNIRALNNLRWLSLENCPHIDDWCLDRIAGEYVSSLEYLNIKNCSKVSERGISGICKLKNLKVLELGGHSDVKNLELVCLMLEDVLPNLTIRGVDYCTID